MSTADPTVLTAPTRPASPADTTRSAGGVVRRRPAGLHYTVATIGITVRNVLFVFFTIALPVMMYLLFSLIMGDFAAGEATVSTMIMVNMAAYGGLGAAITSGTEIQVERATGWMRQLRLAGLTSRAFLTARIVTAMVVVLPAIVVVLVVGALVGDVSATATQWLTVGLFLWAGMLPMVLIGLVLGLLLKPAAVGPASTMLMLLLAMIGGLWFPLQMFPGVMQTIGRASPAFWIAEYPRTVFAGGNLEPQGLLVIGGWMLVLAVIGVLSYGRAIGTSKR